MKPWPRVVIVITMDLETGETVTGEEESSRVQVDVYTEHEHFHRTNQSLYFLHKPVQMLGHIVERTQKTLSENLRDFLRSVRKQEEAQYDRNQLPEREPGEDG